MELLRWFFLESPIAQAIVLGFIAFITLVIWRRGGSDKPFLVAIVIWALAFAAQALVTTPAESARGVMEDVERAVVRNDDETIAHNISHLFQTSPTTPGGPAMDRAAFLSFVRAQLDRVDPHWIQRTGFKLLESQHGKTVCEFSYLAEVTAHDYQMTIPSRWRITLAREGDRWRITSIEPLQIGPRAGAGWRMAEQ
ncbi:MAG: hypothetical protein KDA32_03145 [Phycisphaerales bacterium]|nr:hypothetical protein [Phycisphaerales bacterium]